MNTTLLTILLALLLLIVIRMVFRSLLFMIPRWLRFASVAALAAYLLLATEAGAVLLQWAAAGVEMAGSLQAEEAS